MLVAAATLLLHLTPVQAQRATENEAPASTKRYGIETNLVWPFVPGINIWQLKSATVIHQGRQQSGEFILGALYRRTLQDENAAVHREIGGILGYRHFFYKGLHAEFNTHLTAAAALQNKIDQRDYRSFAFTTELYAGYRFEMARPRRVSFYLTPQVGLGRNLYAALGPESETGSGIFPIASLLAGIRF